MSDALPITDDLNAVRQTLRRARARWRQLVATRVLGRWSSAAALVLFLALVAYWLLLPSDGGLLALAAVALATISGLLAQAGRAVWWSPTNRQVARFIEEQCPELEDRLASATECDTRSERHTVMGPHVMADAAGRLNALDLDRVVDRAAMRRARGLTAAAVAALCLVCYVGRKPAARAIDLASLYAFSGQVRIAVSPGHVRLPAGQSLVVSAQVKGARQVRPSLALVSGSARRALAMHPAADPDTFEITLGGVTADFKYAVEAGSAHSAVYNVAVVYPPRVERIDLRYSYPKAFGLEPRVEENGGDIYGPAGTRVRIDVHADKALRDAALVLADGTRVPLSTGSGSTARTEVELTEDTSYRVALNDQDGLGSHGDTEYFIRLLSDRPPEVRILQPAGDTQVTALEEVTIDARADDDHGIDRFDLVYAVRGGKENVMPFRFDRSQPTAEGRQVVFMEDLGVKPGDFVTYFARARDVGRGKRSTEARSDIFFLEVKPFDEEFSLAQSQAMAGGAGGSPFGDLAAAQKEIIIATWKLDRRALGGQSGRSAEDVKAIASAQGQLRAKTEQAAQSQGGLGAARRRRLRVPGEEPANENPLGLAVQAMTRAESALGGLDTKGALPHEMEALNQLLKAQSEIRRWQVSRQQASGGMGGYGRQGQDLSALFDRELQRQQQTNYENPTTTEQRKQGGETNDALDKVRELARRQDELAKQQQELARQKQQLTEEELKRQLERLTREQSELRRQAEELSQQMARQQGRGQGQGKSGGGASGRSDNNENSRMRDIAEEMRNAASDLRRDDLERASARSGRAGEMLRQLERQLGDKQPNERARRLGDVQLEARQLADAQQRVASEANRMTKGTSADELRRLAGEKDRLADRTEALTEAVKRAADETRGQDTQSGEAQALGDAVKQLERQQLDRQVRESAGRLRAQGEAVGPSQGGAEPQTGQPPRQPQVSEADARHEQELLQAYERLAERLSGATGPQDKDADRLSDSMARAQELRQRWEQLSRDQERWRDQAARSGAPDQNGRQSGSASGRDGSGRGRPGSGQGREGSGEGREGKQGSGAGLGGGGDLARLRDEQQRQMRQAEELMNELQQMNPGLAGRTPEGQQMVKSAPGTEAFKQDFAKWDQLRKAIDSALEQTEQSLSQSLRERLAKDRLNAGAGDHTPEQYRKLVEKYYQALAARKK